MNEIYPDIAERIVNDSAIVDAQFKDAPEEAFYNYSLNLPVPPHHARANSITATTFRVGAVNAPAHPSDVYYLVDVSLQDSALAKELGDQAHIVEATEDTLKELAWLDNFVETEVPTSSKTVIGIGGGILLNAAAYIAEKWATDFVSVPTTVLAAADSAIGGLVRINKVDGEQFIKSAYKSTYEPSSIVIDPALLATLPKSQINYGLSEVVKHGVYQSTALLEYLASDAFQPFDDQASLLKAVCWTAALKNVAIEHDPDSLSSGGDILRGGHKLALSIEEATHFRVSHGQAVAVGVYQDALQDPAKIVLLDKIYQKLALPKAQSDLPTF